MRDIKGNKRKRIKEEIEMNITVNFKNGVTATVHNNFTNCHQFTRAVLINLFLEQRIPCNNEILNFIHELNLAADDMTGITTVYQDMIELFAHEDLKQNECLHLPPCCLIVFKQGEIIQHSMLTLGEDYWIGANNRTSLGLADGDRLNNKNEIDGIVTYLNMSQRKYEPLIGGWNNDNELVNVYGDSYKLYVIPLIDIDYSAQHTCCAVQ